MSLLRNIGSGLRSLFRKEQVDRELEEELRAYQEMAAEEKMKGGLSRKEALRAVRLERGSVDVSKEMVRSGCWEFFLETCWQDLRVGLRAMRKNPGFVAVAILTLTLGIGATTAIFSVVDAVLLRPLPYRDPNRLVRLFEDRTRDGFPRKEFTPANYADCRAQTQIFSDMSAGLEDLFNLSTTGGEPERLMGERYTWDIFSILGVQPLIGRVFDREDDRPGFEHVTLISYRLWHNRFGADPNIVGRDLLLNGDKYRVIGVMPRAFSFPTKDADLWIPVAFTSEQLASRGEHYLNVVARLQQGVTLKQANAELQVLAHNLIRQNPEIMNFVDGFVAEPLPQTYTRDVSRGLVVLLAAVGFILLIACANIANLLLSRAASRQPEIALRSALGAVRSRIVRQLLTECSLLAVIGGALGVLLAVACFRLLKILVPPDLARTVSLTLNFPVLTFSLLIVFASTFLFGLAPALQISKADVNESLKEGGRAGMAGRRKGLGNLLVIGEIALSVVLLAASGLLLDSFVRMRHVDPGFRSDHVLTLEIPVSTQRNPDFVRRTQFFQAVLERVRTLPGVKSAGFMSVLPLVWKSGMAGITPDGEPLRPDISYDALDRVVSDGYFETMRIPLLRGRLFDGRDGPDAPSVGIVNETMARKFWPNEDALGKRMRFDEGHGKSRLVQIVGIVHDVKQMGLDVPPKEEMYFPYWQAKGNYMMPGALAIRTKAEPMSVLSAVREVVRSIDPQQPISEVMTMDDILDREVEGRRDQASLLAGLAALALLLACIGIYGVMAYLVAQQVHEFGVRAALGAQPRDIFALVLARGLAVTAAGIVTGILAAVLSTRLIGSLLFGVSPFDPVIFAGVVLLLGAVALTACYFPARRAMRVDPMTALRCE